MSEPVNFVIEHYGNEKIAEVNEQLALIVARLQAENAKLRKFAKIDTEDIDTMSCLVDDLRAENDRLREMAAQALQIIKHVGAVMAIDYARYSALMSMARDLGIEVSA